MRRAARQLNFLKTMNVSTRLDHGGDIGKGRRKTMRPFSPKRPLHLVLRSSQARGSRSLLHPKFACKVEQLIQRHSKKYHVQVYRKVNVGNHLHLIVQAKTRKDFQSFLRALTGAIAFLITGACKSNPLSSRFWDKLAYSRVVSWGREFDLLHRYLVKNMFEAHGFWNRKREQDLELVWISMKEAGFTP